MDQSLATTIGVEGYPYLYPLLLMDTDPRAGDQRGRTR